MVGVVPVPCEDFLVVRYACVLVNGAQSCLWDSAISSSEFWGIYGFGMALASLYANVQSCAPVFLRDWCGISGTEAYWLLGGAWS